MIELFSGNGFRAVMFCLAGLILTGYASFGKGVAEAVMEQTDTEDTRVCEIFGEHFEGLDAALGNHQEQTKVLMVHGVGVHEPGYATEFLEKLAAQLDLTVRSKRYKDISLTSFRDQDKKLGNLRVTRLLNKQRSKELLLYELTWSEITEDEKALLSFDNSGEYSFRRAEVNNMLKKFTNDTGPDPIIYLGKSRDDILTAFTQSFCWMIQGDWQSLPEQGRHACNIFQGKPAEQIAKDNYAFISHSLGSRITIDGMQRIAEILGNPEKYLYIDGQTQDISKRMIAALRKKHLPIFMLSNQLPMLQLGREIPETAGQKEAYCFSSSPQYEKRMVSKTSIIAFSDPNDLLSYAIPQGFSEKYLDSRLCIEVTNININIAKVIDAFGLGKIANPLDAHIGYDTDDRVVALIAGGIGNSHTAPIVQERCKWIELTE